MLHLLEMGERFCETAERCASSSSPARVEDTFQQLHWGLELVLKAHLHHRGWDDRRCIAEVRHDLAKALAACEREGLRGVGDDVRSFLGALAPYSRDHRVDEFVRDGADGWTPERAIDLAGGLRAMIRDAVT